MSDSDGPEAASIMALAEGLLMVYLGTLIPMAPDVEHVYRPFSLRPLEARFAPSPGDEDSYGIESSEPLYMTSALKQEADRRP